MDVRDFEYLFKCLYLPLGMYSLRIVGDTDASEDIVQNAFSKAWLQLRSGLEITDFKAYMYRIVRNDSLTYVRDTLRQVPIEDYAAEEPVEDELIDTSERDASIWRAIDALPERCREVFLLSKRDGLSNEEIAAELGITLKTVKNQMTKAFSRLRGELVSGHKPFFLPFL